jgi:hypothetical protein
MQFGYVKSLAEGVAKEKVRDAVVTVSKPILLQDCGTALADKERCRYRLTIHNMNDKLLSIPSN